MLVCVTCTSGGIWHGNTFISWTIYENPSMVRDSSRLVLMNLRSPTGPKISNGSDLWLFPLIVHSSPGNPNIYEESYHKMYYTLFLWQLIVSYRYITLRYNMHWNNKLFFHSKNLFLWFESLILIISNV